jgi:hypothetical protein
MPGCVLLTCSSIGAGGPPSSGLSIIGTGHQAVKNGSVGQDRQMLDARRAFLCSCFQTSLDYDTGVEMPGSGSASREKRSVEFSKGQV